MIKHPYQTCLRMPLTLKEDMTSICDQYHINESDLMRKQSFSSLRTSNETQTSTHDTCSFEGILEYPSDMTF